MMKTICAIALVLTQYAGFGEDIALDFTAVYDSRKHIVKIKWQNKFIANKAFVVQRSSDNTTWIDIALHQVSKPGDDRSYYFEDKKPASGDNYYRLKYVNTNDQTGFTPSVMIITGSSGYNWVMYPVPVKDVLTLQYRGSEEIRGVVNVLLQTSSGHILTRLRHASTARTIQLPVSNLGRGIYDIRIIVENEIIWNQRFIK
jgi:trimeric autotransporter adhesin